MEALDPTDPDFLKDPMSFPLPHGTDDWRSLFPQCTAHDDLFDQSAESNTSLFAGSCLNDLDLDLNVDLDADLYLDPFISTSSLPISARPDLCSVPAAGPESHAFNDHDEPMLDCSTLPDYFSDRIPAQPLSTPPFAVPESILTPFPTPPPPTAAASCIAQQRPPCMITATQSLRSLHIRQNSCLSRRPGPSCCGSHDTSGPEQPRMSGSVLKCNKDAGMSVCRMLQCACALRPQNQLMLAIICSKLIAWYRAMIRTCFLGRHGANSALDEDTSLEKVVHQPVTIGDHSVDDQALGLTIQTQVTLGELRHMQRLVETLSARIRETRNPHPKAMSGFEAEPESQSTGLPGVAHDQLVTHLLKEVHAAKADLVTA
ncbi:uncharacterized protein N7529_008473 [Penicillium soppii]|uniref:uncharacterized protein n=1 Tax=Penicillium soppii TaxID=69789 RepID=UPI0025488A2F|nr:uncharacterized protein N7529_008473 [Penicillium soppii]KAJ5861163.1 hypothetical protein N7529_008473 [Penicillium soppii]